MKKTISRWYRNLPIEEKKSFLEQLTSKKEKTMRIFSREQKTIQKGKIQNIQDIQHSILSSMMTKKLFEQYISAMNSMTN